MQLSTAVRPHLLLTILLLLATATLGCRTLPQSPPAIPSRGVGAGHTLTLIVSELQMHLREDTYHSARARHPEGRDVYQAALWRLDRLQSARGLSPEHWENVDLVIEYARARALERSRRYIQARDAYERVAQAGSLLAEPAADAREVLSRFARHSGPPLQAPLAPAKERKWIDERVAKWRELAWEYRHTSHYSLAREEVEAWETARIEALLRHGDIEAAIHSCHGLIERHRSSKLYARHLIRLGDLYGDAARREFMRYAVDPRGFDVRRYESYLDRAFSSYELAGEQRRPTLRAEAAKKIEALLASHQGVRTHVR